MEYKEVKFNARGTDKNLQFLSNLLYHGDFHHYTVRGRKRFVFRNKYNITLELIAIGPYITIYYYNKEPSFSSYGSNITIMLSDPINFDSDLYEPTPLIELQEINLPEIKVSKDLVTIYKWLQTNKYKMVGDICDTRYRDGKTTIVFVNNLGIHQVIEPYGSMYNNRIQLKLSMPGRNYVTVKPTVFNLLKEGVLCLN